MFKPQLTIPDWLSNSFEVRREMVKIFDLPRSGGTVVHSHGGKAEVITDGYTHDDLSKVTIEKMQKFLGSIEKNFFDLLNETFSKIESNLIGEKEQELAREKVEAEEEEKQIERIVGDIEKMVATIPKRRGRPAKVQ